MIDEKEQERSLQSVALQNATSVFLARQRAEQELIDAKEELEAKTSQLAKSLEMMEHTLIERDRARGEAELARLAAQEANDAKGRFLRMISHELRTPLGAIGGYAALIEEGIHGPITDAQRESLGRIQHGQRHLLSLVNELLDFARIESGGMPIHVTDIDVGGLLKSALTMIEPQLKAKNLHLDVELPQDLRIFGDNDRVEQIVLNLLSNAAEFTDDGGRIKLWADTDAIMVRIHIRDNGIGIQEERLQEIFESFVQVAPSLSKTGGTGLGLSSSQQLARAMGGEVTVESTFGLGSTFTLRLPAARGLHLAVAKA